MSSVVDWRILFLALWMLSCYVSNLPPAKWPLTLQVFFHVRERRHLSRDARNMFCHLVIERHSGKIIKTALQRAWLNNLISSDPLCGCNSVVKNHPVDRRPWKHRPVLRRCEKKVDTVAISSAFLLRFAITRSFKERHTFHGYGRWASQTSVLRAAPYGFMNCLLWANKSRATNCCSTASSTVDQN